MMTAKSIKSAAFESEKNGYNPAQVDRFLAEVAKEFAALEAENADSEAKISKLVEKVSEYKEDEDAIKDALLSAQKEASKIINDAKNKAAAIVDGAKSEQRKLAEQSAAECEKIVREHKERCAMLIKENTEITEQKISSLREAYDEEKAAYEELRAEVTYFKANLTELYKQQLQVGAVIVLYPAPHPEVLILLAVRLPLVYALKLLLVQHGEALLCEVCLVRQPCYYEDLFLCRLLENILSTKCAVTDKVLQFCKLLPERRQA